MKARKTILIIVGMMIIACITLIILNIFNKNEKPIKNETKVLETIEKYGYNLEDRDYEIYKNEYNLLKTNLDSEEISLEEYAKSIAKLYIIDLYTLENKINKYDVGGIEFILDEAKENYKLKVEDTLYKYLNDNTYNDRKEVYPIVSKVEVTSSDTTTYKYNDKKYSGYTLELTWEYEKNDKYDTAATIIIIEKDDKLFIVNEEAK